MNRSMITNIGFNKINEARPNGISIELMYYVPVYDDRITYYGNTDISSVTESEDTTPTGKVYWGDGSDNPFIKPYGIIERDDGFEIENIDEYIPEDIDNPTYKNLYEGITFKNSAYDITVSISKGTIRFNKLALYAVMKSEDGLLASNPFLFAQVITTQLVEIKESSIGSEEAFASNFVLRFPINISSIDHKFDGGSFSSTSNYWEDVIYNGNKIGLDYNDGFVFSSNSLGLEDRSVSIPPKAKDIGVSKFLSSTYHSINNENKLIERNVSQLTLQYVTSACQEGEEENSYCNRNRSIFKIIKEEDNYHLEINMSSGCLSSDDNILQPKASSIFAFGKPNQKWKSINLFEEFEILNYDEILEDKFYFNSNVTDKTVSVFNGSVYCGPFTSSNNSYMCGNISSYISNDIHHDLLIRSFKSTAIVNLNKNSSGDSEDIINSIKNGDSDSINDEHSLYLVSKRINVFGNVLALNQNDSIGDKDKTYKAIYARSFFGDENHDLTIEGNLIAGTEKNDGIIPMNLRGWNTLYTNTLGSENERVMTAYSNSLTSNKIILADVPSENESFPLGISFNKNNVEKLVIGRYGFLPLTLDSEYKIGDQSNKVNKIFAVNIIADRVNYNTIDYAGQIVWVKNDIVILESNSDIDRPYTSYPEKNNGTRFNRNNSNKNSTIKDIDVREDNEGNKFLYCTITHKLRWFSNRNTKKYWYPNGESGKILDSENIIIGLPMSRILNIGSLLDITIDNTEDDEFLYQFVSNKYISNGTFIDNSLSKVHNQYHIEYRAIGPGRMYPEIQGGNINLISRLYGPDRTSLNTSDKLYFGKNRSTVKQSYVTCEYNISGLKFSGDLGTSWSKEGFVNL